ncbi:beta-lactamase [Leptospira ryugenii]|uniref:Beta-lactamase n=1 Tax=Leptospira ryugenii TaxID=1917863 RepID=A0A2P2DV66_9LEPT|nr:serine hydrolase domain-containing protein [Leptospira ryugenii]GBF48541.1 beta-lactamase [Leptospira ryugenii]
MKKTIYITALLFASLLLFQCQTETKTDTGSQAVLLASILAPCTSLNDCFDRFARSTDEGATLQVFDQEGNTIYSRSSTLEFDTVRPIASGSKWVTAVTAMRAIQAGTCTTGGTLSLNSTTASVLGWTGTKGTITLRQLLAFTSGLNAGGGNGSGQAACISTLPANATNAQKDACINEIRDQSTGTPGALYQYNSNHMAVAQRMLEVSCSQTWNALFSNLVATPLAWPTTVKWTGNIRSTEETDGSLAGAYGLSISAKAYAGMLKALVNNSGNAMTITGTNVPNFLSTNSVTEILGDQYGQATIGYSQFSSFGYRWRYGLGNWRFCSVTDVASECNKDLISHSIGANGFYPWVDNNRKYMAIVAVNNTGRRNGISLLPATANSLFFAETIRPYIHSLLR